MKALLPAFFIFFAFQLKSQTLTYDIFLFGSKIGQSVIERNVKNDSITEYQLHSSSEAHIFFTTRKITLTYQILYKRGLLFSSYSRHTRNDELQITTITQSGNSYLMKRNNEDFCLKGLVDCSTVKLFYAEPCSPTQVFSERLGEYRTLKKTGEGVYEAEMSDGITYYYHYQNGRLKELEMRKGLIGSVYLRPHQ